MPNGSGKLLGGSSLIFLCFVGAAAYNEGGRRRRNPGQGGEEGLLAQGIEPSSTWMRTKNERHD